MGSDHIQIRRLAETDYDDWRRLRFALWSDYSDEAMTKEMADLWQDQAKQPVFVAEKPNGGLCGLVEVSLHNEAPGCTTSPIGYLEAWIVDPEYRGQGIGRRLVAVAEAWAIKQGCVEMASDTNTYYPVSPIAHAHLGYVEVQRDIFFRKSLSNSVTNK